MWQHVFWTLVTPDSWSLFPSFWGTASTRGWYLQFCPAPSSPSHNPDAALCSRCPCRSSWVSGSGTPGFRRRTFGTLISTMRSAFTQIACVLQWKHLVYEEGIESSCGWGKDSKATRCWYNYQNFRLKTCFSTWTIASMSTNAARAWKISSESK